MSPPAGPQGEASAWSRTAPRLKSLPVLKALGITAFMTAFFSAYFHLLAHPARPVQVMPWTALDDAVPFQAWALWPYASLWVYVCLPPALQHRFIGLLGYGVWIGGLCLSGLAIFYWWPTAVPPSGLDLSAHPGFGVLQGVDAAGNACPSLHVATAVFSAGYLHAETRSLGLPRAWRWASLAWAALIVWSTMATRQHVAWDVAGGTVLALAWLVPALAWQRRGQRDGAAL